MDNATAWWIGAGMLLVIEMVTGTFYLLMLALGMAAAAVLAHAGGSLNAQITLAAVVGLAAVAAWHQLRARRRGAASARAERSVVLDIGEELEIDAWSEDGLASVRYRGAQWTAVPPPGQRPSPCRHRVVALSGNRLVVEKI